MSTIRSRWTTQILHTTAFVHNQKEKLLTAHAGGAFFVVISIITAEVFLGIISLPLYLIAKPAVGSDEGHSEYKVRRTITLSILVVIFIIWLLKLIFIIGLSLYFDPRALYSIKETGIKNSSVSTITTDVAIAPVDTGVTAPKVIAAEQNGKNTVTIRGTSDPKAVLAVYLTKEQTAKSNASVHMYADWADKDGRWEITEDENVYLLPPGNYVASAVEYNETSHTKSALSNGIPFTIHDSYLHQFLRRFDTVLNIAVGLGLGGNESYPDVFAPFGGFADDCPVENSRVRLPDLPGIGFEAKAALYRIMRPLAEG